MSLYGNLDGVTGNSKPKYANTSSVYGVSATEAANTLGDGSKVAHAGWVQQTLGTGGLASITITSAGSGVNAAGSLTISGGGGTGAAATYTTANSQNTLQTWSTNSAWNVLASVVITNPGSGYTSAPTVTFDDANTTRPTLTATLGGRAGRRFYETLVAGGSITGDNAADDTYFPGT